MRRPVTCTTRFARLETRANASTGSPDVSAAAPTPTSETHSVFNCPVCGDSTSRVSYGTGSSSVCCVSGHTVDVAREGHVNLLAAARGGRKKSATGDTAEMVQARRRFLDKGHYSNAAEVVGARVVEYLEELGTRSSTDASNDTDNSNTDEEKDQLKDETHSNASSSENTTASKKSLSARAKRLASNKRKSQTEKAIRAMAREKKQLQVDTRQLLKLAPIVVDFGCGEGWWLEQVIEKYTTSEKQSVVNFAGLDASPAACKSASRRVSNTASIAVADAQRNLPFTDASIDVAISVFAPRNPQELARVVKRNGIVVVTSPNDAHLSELRVASENNQLDGMTILNAAKNKKTKVTETMTHEGFFLEVECVETSHVMELGKSDVADIIGMGPSAFHDDENSENEKSSSVFGEDGDGVVSVTNAFVIQTFVRRVG